MQTVTKEELELMDDYARMYETENASGEQILRNWEMGKAPLINAFPSLIMKKPFAISTDKGTFEYNVTRDDDVCRKVGDIYELFYAFQTSNMFTFSDITDYDTAYYYPMPRTLLDTNTIVNGFPIKMTVGNSQHHCTISKGTKFGKAVRKVTKTLREIYPNGHCHLDAIEYRLENLETYLSTLTNSASVSGNLCISIHPLDFMTMSDNNYNWHSCMSWTNSGCYRAGSLEMMESPIVVCGYLEGAEPFYPVGGFRTWSNKKWRELFIVDHDVLASVKGYPYHSDILEDACLDFIAEIVKDCFGWTYGETQKYKGSDSFTVGKTNCWFETTLMYNDIDNNSCTTFKVRATDQIPMIPDNITDLAIPYGQRPHCICCGNEIEDERVLTCPNCDESAIYCTCCGDRVDEDYVWYDDDGNPYCEYCFNDNFTTCEHCGCTYPDDDCYPVAVYYKRGGGLCWDRNYVCADCIKECVENGDIAKDDEGDYYYTPQGCRGSCSVHIPTYNVERYFTYEEWKAEGGQD